MVRGTTRSPLSDLCVRDGRRGQRGGVPHQDVVDAGAVPACRGVAPRTGVVSGVLRCPGVDHAELWHRRCGTARARLATTPEQVPEGPGPGRLIQVSDGEEVL